MSGATFVSRSPPCAHGPVHRGRCSFEPPPPWYNVILRASLACLTTVHRQPRKASVGCPAVTLTAPRHHLQGPIRSGRWLLVPDGPLQPASDPVGARLHHDSPPFPADDLSRLDLQVQAFHDLPCPFPDLHECRGGDVCAYLSVLRFIASAPIGTSLSRDFFRGSPQEHAILNRHLADYFRSRQRANETTPYQIPTSQVHLLSPLGMELPQPDAPCVPHGLHKAIEEGQLRRMRQFLAPGSYGLVSVKQSKVALLPAPASVQNPVYQAKDVSRYPGAGITSVDLSQHPTYLMHDVSSEVGPHELVERLDSQSCGAQLFVTGINPIEVVDRARSFEPSSHVLDYDLDGFNFVFTDSESESYFTPVSTTVSWLRTSAVRASSGRVYQVVLLDYKLGHCLWHVFPADVEQQHTRTFSTGSYVQLPAALTGTWQSEWLPLKLVVAVLSFVDRTPDLSTRNIAAKVAQLSTAVTPRVSSREQWIATHIARQRAPIQGWAATAGRVARAALYCLTFQFQLLTAAPDIYSFLDEHKRYRVLHPTEGGGWVPQPKFRPNLRAIPNSPTMLMRVSAFTSAALTYLIPKLVLGEGLSLVFSHLGWLRSLRVLGEWADISLPRLALTAAVVAVTSVLPGHVIKVFTRLSGHFWRQLWLPGWLHGSYSRAVTELCGGPGALWLATLPGRGWFWQAYLWALFLKSLLPNLLPHYLLPWAVTFSPLWWIVPVWLALAILENCIARFAWHAHSWRRPEPLPSLSAIGFRPWTARLPHFLLVSFGRRLAKWSYNLMGDRDLFLNQPEFHNLPAVSGPAPTSVRKRLVDIPLPSLVVQPSRIPMAQGASAVAVSPQGLDFVEWLKAVETAYKTDPTRYPALTPNASCFWDCVASFGGTAHMWYSWFMAYTGKQPDPTDPRVGLVTQSDISVFAAASGFGIQLSGLCSVHTAPTGNGWPLVNMTLSRSYMTGEMHVELTTPLQLDSAISDLARLLATMRRMDTAVVTALIGQFNASAVWSVPSPSPDLRTMMGSHPLPSTREQLGDAIIASYSARPINMNKQEGFAVPAVLPAPALPYFHYEQPAAAAKIGGTAPAGMWARFRSGKFSDRLWLSTSHTHPQIVSGKIGSSPAVNRANARGNTAPRPSGWTVLRNELSTTLAKYVPLALPAVTLACETISYTADIHRAARLVADLKSNPSTLGALGQAPLLQSLDSVLDSYKSSGKTVTVPVHCYVGVAGCGKTAATRAYLSGLDPDVRRQARVVSHTDALRAENKVSLDYPEFRGFNLPTLASCLVEPTSGPVVFDDAGKFWGGTLDLLLLCNPLLPEVVVNGDPAQGQSRFPVPGTQSEYDPSPLHAIAPLVTRYATVSYRLPRLVADTLGVHTASTQAGHLTHTPTPKRGIPVITASPRYVNVLSASGREAYTYDTVQGLTFDGDAEVDITGLEGATADSSALVALTRSKTGTYLHMDPLDSGRSESRPPTGSDLLNALTYALRSQASPTLLRPDVLVKAAFYAHLERSMPSLAWFAPIGSSLPASAFQSIAPFADTTFSVETSCADGEVCDQTPTAAPPSDPAIPEVQMHAKEYRELPGRGGATDQFKETAFINPHVHKRGDTATYHLSVEQRLTSRTRAQNISRMEACPRRDMIDEFDRLVPDPPKWSALKHAEYTDKAMVEYQSKRSAESVLAKIRASDPLRTGSDIVISLKNQVIKKAEKKAKVNAIPGQLIHEYDLTATMADAPYALFLENELFDAFPRQFLFYRRMAPEAFIAAYEKRWRVGNGVHCSDVTRWDSGCDAAMLNLDVHIMTRCAFPADYIASYRERRLSSRSQHGPMATMQNSGDRYTWALNSIRRAVVTSLINSVTEDDTVAINGDDAALDRFADVLPFPDSSWEFKSLNGYRGEFSGFEVGGPKPTYDAAGLLYRAMILESRDPSALDKWDNYLGLLAHADHDHPAALQVLQMASTHLPEHRFLPQVPPPLLHHITVI